MHSEYASTKAAYFVQAQLFLADSTSYNFFAIFPHVTIALTSVSNFVMSHPIPISSSSASHLPNTSVMFEDSFKNLITAKSMGISTVLVQSETATEEGIEKSHLEAMDAVVNDVSSSPMSLVDCYISLAS